MNSESEKIVYSQGVLEFVQVAARFCAFLEQPQDCDRRQYIATLLRLMPMLYVQAQLLPAVQSDGDFLPADQVTEQDYEWVRDSAFRMLGSEADSYLELVYGLDMQTDDTQWRSISEDLADVYQAVRNFVAAYQRGIEDCMHDALWLLQDNFDLYWGQTLLDALRRLHRIRNQYEEDPE